jgi:quinol monooxygenase YgiN
MGGNKMVTIIWDTLLKEEHQAEGVGIVRRIWKDMKQFDGYIDHEILLDADDPNHVVITSHWTKRELADQTMVIYAASEPVRLLSPLLAGPRKRTAFYGDVQSYE